MEKGYNSRVPVYLKIAYDMREKILLGDLKPQQKMPSIRKLALELNLNPNTVKKAYEVLENQKLIKSNSTAGTFVTDDLELLLEERINNSFETITLETKELKKLGVSLSSVLEGIEKKWKVL